MGVDIGSCGLGVGVQRESFLEIKYHRINGVQLELGVTIL